MKNFSRAKEEFILGGPDPLMDVEILDSSTGVFDLITDVRLQQPGSFRREKQTNLLRGMDRFVNSDPVGNVTTAIYGNIKKETSKTTTGDATNKVVFYVPSTKSPKEEYFLPDLNTSSVNNDMLDETQLEEEDDEEVFTCFLCNFRSRETSVLGEHVATQHSYIFKASNSKSVLSKLTENCVTNSEVSHMDVTADHSSNKGNDSNPRLNENDVTFQNNDNSENRCTLCKLTFSSKSSLRRHSQLIHFKNGEFPCQKCENVFNEKNQLKLHLISVHFHPMNIPVEQCDISLNDQGLKIYCKVCNTVFSDFRSLKHHERKFHPDGGIRTQHEQSTLNPDEEIKSKSETFECNFCGKKFGYLYNMKRHIKRTHRKSSVGDGCQLTTFVDDSAPPNHLRDTHQNELNESYSKSHTLEDSKNLNNQNDPVPSLEEMASSNSTSLCISQEETICGYCGKNVSSARNLRRHIKLVHMPEESSSSGVEINICDHCGKRFLFRESLIDHFENCYSKASKVKSDDNQEIPTECGINQDVENQDNPTKGQLNQGDENEEQIFKNSSSFIQENVKEKFDVNECRQNTFDISIDNECNLCGKKFSIRQNVARHIKMVHLHERKHECKECDKKYVDRRALLKHINAFHINNKSQNYASKPSNESDEKVFETKAVENANRVEEENQDSTTNSDKVQCSICDKKFTTSRNVDRHIRMVHMKIKDFSCTPCNAKFFAKRDLLNHCVRFHSEDINNEDLQSSNESIEMDDRQVSEMDISGSQDSLKSLKGTDDQKEILNIKSKEIREVGEVVEAGKEVQPVDADEDKIGNVCNVCHKVFADNFKRKRHFRCVHMKERKWVCQNCGRGFQEGRDLRRHLLGCNLKQESSTLNQSLETISRTLKKSTEDRPRKPENNFILSSTMMNDNGARPPKSFDLSPVTMNVKMEDNEDDVSFVEQKKPEIVKSDPVPASIGEKPHVCVECGKTFSSTSSLKRHINSIHLKNGGAFCHLCDKTFSDDSNLRRHTKSIHFKTEN